MRTLGVFPVYIQHADKETWGWQPRCALPAEMGACGAGKHTGTRWLSTPEVHREEWINSKPFFPLSHSVVAKRASWDTLFVGAVLVLPDPVDPPFTAVSLIKRKCLASLILYGHVSLLYYLISDRQGCTGLIYSWHKAWDVTRQSSVSNNCSRTAEHRSACISHPFFYYWSHGAKLTLLPAPVKV